MAKWSSCLLVQGLETNLATYPQWYLAQGVITTKRETVEYLLGERNAVKDEFILSRESTEKADCVYVSHPGVDEPLYKFWQKRSAKCKRPPVVDESIDGVVVPKTTGGKRPYVMLMEGQEAISSLSMGACGFLYKLYNGGHVEWHTGRVIQKRNKSPLTQKAMAFLFNEGKKKIKAIINELAQKDIMGYDKKTKAYIISRAIARKGGYFGADKV